MRKVLHVNKLYSPWIGGVEQVVQTLAEGTATSPGWTAEALVCQARGRFQENLVNGVTVKRVGSLGMFMSLPLAPAYPFMMAKAMRDASVVHLHWPFPLALLYQWESKPRRTKLVVHFHCEITRPSQRAVMRLLSPLERQLFTAADRIVVTSRRMLQNAKSLREWGDKCEVVPLPVLVPGGAGSGELSRAELRVEWGVPKEEKVVLFVGRLVRYKGLSVLLEAMVRCPGYLVIAGDGPLRATLEAQVTERALASRVRFLGRVPERALGRIYNAADLFVLPSIDKAEAFGLVQVEAMAHGCPVINTMLPTGVPEVSVTNQTGLTVPVGDATSLADAITRLIRDDSLRARLGDAARVRAREFDPAGVVAKILDIYERVGAA